MQLPSSSCLSCLQIQNQARLKLNSRRSSHLIPDLIRFASPPSEIISLPFCLMNCCKSTNSCFPNTNKMLAEFHLGLWTKREKTKQKNPSDSRQMKGQMSLRTELVFVYLASTGKASSECREWKSPHTKDPFTPWCEGPIVAIER